MGFGPIQIFDGHVVGGFNPFETYARQNGSFPRFGVKKTKTFDKPPPNKPVIRYKYKVK